VNTNLTPIERWFLEVVVELKYPVACLASPRLDLILNRPAHALAVDQVLDVLVQLQARGLLCFFERDDARETALERGAILEALRGQHDVRRVDRPVYFGMTSLGGAEWERVARPEWALYVDEGYRTDPAIGSLCGIDRHYLARLGARVEERIEGTDRWTPLHPWQATYWKTLPSGHELRFRYERSKDHAPYRVAPDPWTSEDEAAWFTPAPPPPLKRPPG
jgi:hypothetical protein